NYIQLFIRTSIHIFILTLHSHQQQQHSFHSHGTHHICYIRVRQKERLRLSLFFCVYLVMCAGEYLHVCDAGSSHFCLATSLPLSLSLSRSCMSEVVHLFE